MLNRRILGIDEFSARFHPDGLSGSSDIELRVDAHRLAAGERVTRLAENFEAWFFDFDAIGAEDEGRRAVVAGAVRADFCLDACLLVGNCDASFWNCRSARIGNHSCDHSSISKLGVRLFLAEPN